MPRFRRTARQSVATAAAALLLAGGVAMPATADTGATVESTTDTAATSVAPLIHDELVGMPGSLYEVTRAMGLDEPGAPTGDGVGVALIDTGVTDVPALRNSNVTIGPDFSFDAPVEQLRGRDANGHGTHLAGLIAGTDAAWAAGDHDRAPGRQIGVAPDANLVSVKVGAADGAVDVTQVIAAVNWVVEHKDEHDIRVLALAYGTDGTQDPDVDPLSHAVERAWHAGITVVVGAGNDGLASKQFANPATNPWVITAGAADVQPDGTWLVDGKAAAATFASGSSGKDRVEVVAPGRSIVGPRVVGAYADGQNSAGRVGTEHVKATGTSQATALVAGAAAALLEARPELTPAQVRVMLQSTGADVGGDSSYNKSGFVRVDAAVQDPGGYVSGDDVAPYELWWTYGDGTGSVDASRGTHRVAIDGVAISGETDVFGADWSDVQWTDDSFGSMSWNGMSWNSMSWNGMSWNSMSWNGDAWSSMSWNGMSWNSMSWNGMSWNGMSWNGMSWNSMSWNGMSWNGMSWNGSTWG